MAVDSSRYLLDSAILYVRNNTSLLPKNCKQLQCNFETLQATDIKNLVLDTPKLYTFLGNTYNNFKKEVITPLLHRLLDVNDALIIGIKVRRNSLLDEQQRLIDDHSSFGPEFTYTFAHILGLRDDQVERETVYNAREERIEIWLRVLEPSFEMNQQGLSNCTRILTSYTYYPTVDEFQDSVDTFFETLTFTNKTGTHAIFLCTKK